MWSSLWLRLSAPARDIKNDRATTTMKPGLGDRFFYAESGGWALARIFAIAVPAVLVLAIGTAMFIELWTVMDWRTFGRSHLENDCNQHQRATDPIC